MSKLFEKMAIIGAGSMGSNMAMLFASTGRHVSLFDISAENLKDAQSKADADPESKGRVSTYGSYGDLIASLPNGEPRLFLFSISHGKPTDTVIESLRPYLRRGDILVDAGNEWYRDTCRRYDEMKKIGVGYVGMGVSGGYQSARRGPSCSPGGDADVVESVMPLLKEIAAKDVFGGKGDGGPCVARIGPDGAGHHVKMTHNGIEHAMMSVIGEVFELMGTCQGDDYDQCGHLFRQWAAEGDLKQNFLLEIAADVCLHKEPHSATHTLSRIQDKVVQDADDTEGTGPWTVIESARRHVSAPSIASAQYLRVASADRAQRLRVAQLMHIPPPHRQEKGLTSEDLRLATYGAFLASYVQGLNLILKASTDEQWGVRLSECIRIWRAGCIIRSTAIADLLQAPLANAESNLSDPLKNVLHLPVVANELTRCYPAMKRAVACAVEWDARAPVLAASLEYVKYVAGEKLPMAIHEGMMDYFGSHNYDVWEDGPGEVKKGKHHTEWKSTQDV
ncbi:6-phosphogluconate dehydrogenase, decarboxylating [Leucogyrophana mollusca]|uniref:6-phosphogluconate dehydrogenase, decarboxylating n=1 Tax=Leucogyrophana mollusca TaxID=85980 RepID=A0ACB8BWB7_9AGAM|nr:6-phosphogluconate dehydrogenase, decarboxylating [Leucogyrophana mollusca]